VVVADQATSPAETPEVKRRRLRFALRDARRESKLTQHIAAKKLSWSPSKIVRIEQGTVPVAPTDVRAMLFLYGVTDQERVESLVTLAAEAREMKGFKQYADIYSPAALELFGSESAAQVIYKHEPTMIPGLLQTRDYANALLISLGDSPEDAARKAAARIERQVMLEREDRPELNFVIGEAALVRPAGGKEIMAEQIAALRRYSREDDINLYALPFSAGAHRGLGEAFTILQFANEDDPDVLYLENAERLSVSREDEDTLKRYQELFVHLKEIAESCGDFETVLDEVVGSRFE
jgi:transcriptional regulator with XRE-family HTH domain